MGNVLPVPPWSSSSSLCQYTSEWASAWQGTGSQRIMVRIDLAQSVRGQWGGDTRMRWSEKGTGRGRRNGLTIHYQTFTESPGSSLTLHSCLLFLESRGWISLINVPALGGKRWMPVLQCRVLWEMEISLLLATSLLIFNSNLLSFCSSLWLPISEPLWVPLGPSTASSPPSPGL